MAEKTPEQGAADELTALTEDLGLYGDQPLAQELPEPVTAPLAQPVLPFDGPACPFCGEPAWSCGHRSGG